MTDDWFADLDDPENVAYDEMERDYYEKWRRQERVKRKTREELDKEEDAQRVLRAKPLSDEEEEDTHWLWQYRIPLADFTIVGGRAGIGKSLFLCTLAAWITTGDCRGAFDGIARNIIFIANEDSYKRTVVPRLRAAGADLSRIFRIEVEFEGEEVSLSFPRDLVRLGELVRDVDACAIIIDPVSSNMADRDRNSPEVRANYERLRRFAEVMGVAVVGNGHLKKGQFKDFLEGFMGSSEIGNIARAAIGIALDTDSEEREVIVSQCKNNNGPMDLKSYTYRVVGTEYERPDGSVGSAAKLSWGEPTDRHVNDIFSEPLSMDHKSEAHECKEWLKDYLQLNPGVERVQVYADGRKAGFKDHTIKAAGRSVARSENVPGSFPRRTAWHPKRASRDSQS